ncbi:MAG: energy transducer TonB [Opitutaceae bacterium]
MRGLFLVSVLLSFCLDCAGCISPGEPLVTLVSVTQAANSPARGAGYPISTFPLPVYPRDFARAGITGDVTVRVTVGKDGRVAGAKITKSNLQEFESPVLAAIMSWRFFEMREAPHADRKGLIVDCVFQFSLE